MYIDLASRASEFGHDTLESRSKILARAVQFILPMLFCFLSIEYRILGKKGEGTFSEVLKVQDIRDGTYFACKKMKQRYER